MQASMHQTRSYLSSARDNTQMCRETWSTAEHTSWHQRRASSWSKGSTLTSLPRYLPIKAIHWQRAYDNWMVLDIKIASITPYSIIFKKCTPTVGVRRLMHQMGYISKKGRDKLQEVIYLALTGFDRTERGPFTGC
jgi:hypothetical protein